MGLFKCSVGLGRSGKECMWEWVVLIKVFVESGGIGHECLCEWPGLLQHSVGSFGIDQIACGRGHESGVVKRACQEG